MISEGSGILLPPLSGRALWSDCPKSVTVSSTIHVRYAGRQSVRIGIGLRSYSTTRRQLEAGILGQMGSSGLRNSRTDRLCVSRLEAEQMKPALTAEEWHEALRDRASFASAIRKAWY